MLSQCGRSRIVSVNVSKKDEVTKKSIKKKTRISRTLPKGVNKTNLDVILMKRFRGVVQEIKDAL